LKKKKVAKEKAIVLMEDPFINNPRKMEKFGEFCEKMKLRFQF